MDAAERHDPGNPTSGADDDLPADLLAQDAIRRADVARAFGSDRRRFQAEAVLLDGRRGLVHHLVLRRPPTLDRQVEAWKRDRFPDDVRREDAQCLLEQFLPGLVALENDDRLHDMILLRRIAVRK